MPDVSVEYNTRSIYHLLRRAFGQCITVAEIVDLNVLDIIPVVHVHLTVYMCSAIVCSSISDGWWGRSRGGLDRTLDWRDIDMLNALLGLNLRVDSRSSGSYS